MKLPTGFQAFVESELCFQLADSILDYVVYLIRLEKKKK